MMLRRRRTGGAASLAIALVRAAFEFQVQKCSAASRAYIPKSLWPAVAKRIKEHLAELQVGDVADPKTFMGAVIDQGSLNRLSASLKAAQSGSEIKVIAGGTASDEVGFFVQPTVLETTNPRHALMNDELFGPVFTVYPYDDAKRPEMLALIDPTSPYALTGSVFSTDPVALKPAENPLQLNRFAEGLVSTGDSFLRGRHQAKPAPPI